MMNKLVLEMEINHNLNDIDGYCESAGEYLLNPYTELDKDEIVMYLSSVTEIIKEVKELIEKLEQEYENEQLQ